MTDQTPGAARSGKFLVRLPVSFHERLAARAERDGVSLNQYVLMLLAMNYRDATHRDFSYETFAFNGCMQKNDGTEFTQEESNRVLAEFLEWVEARGYGFGGMLGTPTP